MIKRLTKILSATALSLMMCASLHAADYEIKMAVLAPEGSTWVKIMQDMDKELQTKSGGKLALKLYAGGVSGDEIDVIRKMRIGQLHAGAFTGVGLGKIVPAVRVLELPMLFQSYEEVDNVKAKLRPQFEKDFSAKGFKILGFAEAGFVNIYANKPIKTMEDMSGTKMWAWEGDPLVQEMYNALGITPIPLSLPDVLPALQTKTIDGVYAPPLGMIALQWFTKTKYMTNVKLANSTGAILITKAQYAKLPADLQKILSETTEAYSKKLVQKIRAENAQALTSLKSNGIEVVEVDTAAKAQITKASEAVYTKLVGKLYSQALLDQVRGYLKAMR